MSKTSPVNLTQSSDDHERSYLVGKRAALNEILRHVLAELGYNSDETTRVRWVIEREQAIAQLRIVCREVGDNKWEETEHLADIIEKHLGKHVMP